MDNIDGPLLLEINIRPGLEVQVANLARLKDRLERVEGVNINSVEKGVRLGKDLFSGDIEGKIEKLSGKKVVGQREYITLEYVDKKYKYLAEIDTGKNISVIDKSFLKNILKIDEVKLEDKKIRIKTDILGEIKDINFLIKELGSVNIILGLNSLKGILIDPFKYKKGELPFTEDEEYRKTTNSALNKNYEKQLHKIDEELISVDKKLLILKNITPTNLIEEKINLLNQNEIIFLNLNIENKFRF
ncbi:MAG: hypothetical protein Q9M97_00145 [Candidatus Gracilibacteria bacterium]|nr:hypothetical protein [Candidatus Gracilibacteria bacterium]